MPMNTPHPWSDAAAGTAARSFCSRSPVARVPEGSCPDGAGTGSRVRVVPLEPSAR